MNWKDKNKENLLHKASNGDLDALERVQLLKFLSEDAELRQQALEMARIQHDQAQETEPLQNSLRAEALHERIIRKAAAELNAIHDKSKKGLFRIVFSNVYAIGAAAAILFFIVFKPDVNIHAPNSSTEASNIVTIEAPTPLPSAIPTQIPEKLIATSEEALVPTALSATASPLSPTAMIQEP